MQGKNHTEAWAAVKAVFWSVLVKNWIIWGIAQYINLSYVPIKVCVLVYSLAQLYFSSFLLQHRVLFANLTALLWNIYLAISRR